MPEAETTAAPVETAAPATTEEPRPDPLAVLTERLSKAEAAVEEAKLQARRTQGDATSNVRRLERAVAELRSTVLDFATQNMEPDKAEAFRAKAALQQYQQTQDAQQQHAQAVSEFETEATAVLSQWGISPTDTRLTQAYQRFAAENNTPAGWRLALNRAIAEVRKDDDEKKDAERKRLEEELAVRNRNAERAAQGPVDRGQPGGALGKRPAEMTDAEFQQHLATLDADYRRTHARR